MEDKRMINIQRMRASWFDNRVRKAEGGETILYINRYYEENLTTGNVTTYYYLGGRRVAMKKDTDLRYIHQDHLTGTALVTSDNGTQIGSIKYHPYGGCRKSQGDLGTDKLFTGQRLDGTGLYYYGARYYDPTIGRFISPDTIIQNPGNPQALNRYSYALNNPLKYIDPSGHEVVIEHEDIAHAYELGAAPPPTPELDDLVDEVLLLEEAWYVFSEIEPEAC